MAKSKKESSSEVGAPSDAVSAWPTKAFFVDMLTRDIPLEQAVLDLVDNCIDGAKRMDASDFKGREIKIELNAARFQIWDNCGGFDRALAKDYAFRFGRPAGTPKLPHSVGLFGVGMKRALFKFGRHFVVRSATTKDAWAIDVDVDTWEKDENDWSFQWADFGDESHISKRKPGTDIIVDKLRTEVSGRFGSEHFVNTLVGLIKSKHRQFIAAGLNIAINDTHLDPTDFYLFVTSELKPGVEILTFGTTRNDTVKARIVVGVGSSSPRDAGWYVVCNGRVILERDRRRETGWGFVENNVDEELRIPSYHNQFARFRGVVYFDALDAGNLPWNTTKTDIDQDSPIWQKTFQHMTEMMRPVINFLNDLDRDVAEFSSNESPLLAHVVKAAQAKADGLTKKTEFRAPEREKMKKIVRTTTIQYSKPVKEVEFLLAVC